MYKLYMYMIVIRQHLNYHTGSVFVIVVANILGGHVSINMAIQTMSLCPPVNVHIIIILLFTQCNIHVCIVRS